MTARLRLGHSPSDLARRPARSGPMAALGQQPKSAALRIAQLGTFQRLLHPRSDVHSKLPEVSLMARSQTKRSDSSAEFELIRRAVRKEEAAVRAIMQGHNRRLYRVARSIVRDDGEAEDVLQEAYLRAFSAMAEFRGDSSLATWLTRIVLNEAFQRLRRRTEHPVARIEPPRAPEAQVIPFPLSSNQQADPERAMAQRELCQLLERAIDDLPEEFEPSSWRGLSRA